MMTHWPSPRTRWVHAKQRRHGAKTNQPPAEAGDWSLLAICPWRMACSPTDADYQWTGLSLNKWVEFEIEFKIAWSKFEAVGVAAEACQSGIRLRMQRPCRRP
jgi:hypothetical protein